jgi:maltooligosyltrehalose trehalohydrolase
VTTQQTITKQLLNVKNQIPPVGAFFKDGKTTFRVWAPEQQHVQVIVDGIAHALEKDADGYWSAVLPDVLAGSKYFFAINEKQLPDPASMSQPDGVHGASVVVDRNFVWSDHSWTGLPLSDMIIYELHVGTFTAQSTFDGVISKLAYLQKLGINAIEIMPVAQFPGARNWGYDGVYPFATQHSYGGVDGLKRLVDAAHRHGIAVLLDVVYNHQGPEGNYLVEYGPYFTDKYKTGWGSAINFDDALSDGVRNFYWQNALMWLDEFHIDGLRLDAVHAIWDNGAVHFIEELRSKVKTLEKNTGRVKVLIAEFDLNNPRYIDPVEKGGYGLDGQWVDEFHHALHSIVTGETNGYYEDFGAMSHFIKTLTDSYVYTGQYSVHRKKRFGKLPKENPYGQFVVFAQNHDQVGNRFLGDRLTTTLSFEALKLTAAACLLTPHIPMLFMGEEYGEKNPFQYFISHTDENLVKAVREGRKKEFSYFNWKGEVPDPQGIETFGKCILSWNYDRDPRSKVLLEYYRWLIAFRKERNALKGRERHCLRILPVAEKRVVLYELSHNDDRIFVALNFGKQQTIFTQSFRQKWRMLFDSSSEEWKGPAIHHTKESEQGESILMNPESVIIFE